MSKSVDEQLQQEYINICVVCNEPIPFGHACMNTFQSFHFKCEREHTKKFNSIPGQLEAINAKLMTLVEQFRHDAAHIAELRKKHHEIGYVNGAEFVLDSWESALARAGLLDLV